MTKWGFIIPLIAIIAIILGIMVMQPPRAAFVFSKPTEVTVTPVAAVIGAFDLTWRFPTYSVDEVAPRFAVTVNQAAVAEVHGNDGSAGGDRTAYSLRVTGQPCDAPLDVQVTAFNAGADMGRFASDVVRTELPCTPPVGSPTVAPTMTAPVATTPAQATATIPPEDARLVPPEDFALIATEDGMHTVRWTWPDDAELDPTFFRVSVSGEPTDVEFSEAGEYEVEVPALCLNNPNFLTLDAFNTDVQPEANSQAENLIEADPGC